MKVANNWNKVYLKDLISLSSGKSKPYDVCVNNIENKNPVFGGNGILGYSRLFNTTGENIIIGRVGENCGSIHYHNGNCWVTDNAIYVKEIKDLIGKKFLFYLLRLLKLNKYKQEAGQPLISQGIICSREVSFPSVEEQKQIINIIEKWNKYIELLDKKILIKKNIKKYLQQVLLTGRVRLKGFEGEWQEYKLSELGNVYSGLKGKSKDDFGDGKKYISYMNVYSNPRINIDIKEFVNVKEGESQNAVRYGDIFFTTSSETSDEVATSSVLLDKDCDDIYLNSFCFGYRLNNFDSLSPEFSQFYFRSSIFRKQMNRIAQGAIRYNLSKRYFLEEKVKLPNIGEQKAISSILSKSDEEITMLEKRRNIIEEQRKYLLNNLVTGEIRLPKFRSNK